MAALFDPTVLNGLALANRTVRSATNERLAGEDGRATPELVAALARLAHGEVGLIISGHAAVSLEGQAGARQLLAHDDSCLPGLTDIACGVHAAGGAVALQIAHAGLFAQPPGPEYVPLSPALPTFDPARLEAYTGRACTEDDLDRLVAAFAAAAVRGKQAGFDAVQVHAAHTYLLGQFLSPFFNTRTDAYGGAPENRARLLLRVVGAVRAAVGPDYPLLVKINSEDFLEPGLTVDESVEIGSMLQDASVDCIEISGGSLLSGAAYGPMRRGRRQGEDEVYYRAAAAAFKKRLRIPLMLVGGIRRLATAQALLRDGLADFIALSRPLICDPCLIQNWRMGTADASACVSDNACCGARKAGQTFACPTYAKTGSA